MVVTCFTQLPSPRGASLGSKLPSNVGVGAHTPVKLFVVPRYIPPYVCDVDGDSLHTHKNPLRKPLAGVVTRP